MNAGKKFITVTRTVVYDGPFASVVPPWGGEAVKRGEGVEIPAALYVAPPWKDAGEKKEAAVPSGRKKDGK